MVRTRVTCDVGQVKSDRRAFRHHLSVGQRQRRNLRQRIERGQRSARDILLRQIRNIFKVRR